MAPCWLVPSAASTAASTAPSVVPAPSTAATRQHQVGARRRMVTSALIDRQEAVRDVQHQDRHGGGILVEATAPAAIGLLAGEQLLGDRRVPLVPCRAAPLAGALRLVDAHGGVVLAVEVVLLLRRQGADRLVRDEELDALLH